MSKLPGTLKLLIFIISFFLGKLQAFLLEFDAEASSALELRVAEREVKDDLPRGT
jgi:hypothetical protein